VGPVRVGLTVAQCGAVVALLTLALTAWLVLATSLFGVTSVRVRGTGLLTPQQVRRAADIPSGVPLARLDTAAVAERVQGIPEVADAAVFRAWPHTLTIVVSERVAVATQHRGGEYWLVDVEGIAFRAVPERPPYPLIELPAYKPDAPVTRAAIIVAQDLSPELVALLEKITAPTPAQVTLTLRDGRTLFWGDSSAGKRKARVATALLGRGGHLIDVSAPGVVTVR
jgi:cell division protein FtsQ